jgi:uncharacterized coiled-coil DUF342 family protein
MGEEPKKVEEGQEELSEEKVSEEEVSEEESDEDHETLGAQVDEVLDDEEESAEDSDEKDDAEEAEEADSAEKESKGGKGKDKKKKKTPKIDVNKSPKLKRLVEEAQYITDVVELKRLRDMHNNETRELINKIKKQQIEASNIRNQAIDYRKKRDDLNKKVQDIKKDKNELSDSLNEARGDLKDAKTESKSAEDVKKRKNQQAQAAKLRRSIEQLEKRIETEDLDMKEENQIVDQIGKLEAELRELTKDTTKPKVFKDQIEKIKQYREGLKGVNDNLKDAAEESQNYHLLYLDVTKEMDELRSEKRVLQRELNENRYIADIYHTRLIELSSQVNRQKKITQKMAFQNKKKVKKEIQKITLQDAKDKLKKGVKLNIFEARAYLEEQANTPNKDE